VYKIEKELYKNITTLKEGNMIVIHPMVNYILAIVAGICIFVFPAILNYIVGAYLILIGLIGLFAKM
jgi:hypothetical protein